MREEAHKLMGTSTYNEQTMRTFRLHNFENRRENNLYSELKRTRLNAIDKKYTKEMYFK